MAKAAHIKDVRLRADKDGCLGGPAFLGALNMTWKESRERPETQITLLLLDLDNLHQLNTVHGREAGDRAIGAVVTELARAAKRESWTLGRIGGDEFALLAPGLTVEAAFLRADALRRDIDAALAKVLARGQRCTVSIGVANIPRDAKDPEDLMRKGDLALYAAKEQGGDTVGLTPADDMVLKSSYYSAAQLARLKALAERKKTKEAVLLREGLEDVLRKYDRDWLTNFDKEVAQLAANYGEPRRVEQAIRVFFDPVQNPDRSGEVRMVLRRRP